MKAGPIGIELGELTTCRNMISAYRLDSVEILVERRYDLVDGHDQRIHLGIDHSFLELSKLRVNA